MVYWQPGRLRCCLKINQRKKLKNRVYLGVAKTIDLWLAIVSVVMWLFDDHNIDNNKKLSKYSYKPPCGSKAGIDISLGLLAISLVG